MIYKRSQVRRNLKGRGNLDIQGEETVAQMINMQYILKGKYNDFPSGPVVKDLFCNAGDADLFLCQRTQISHATEQLGLRVSNRGYALQVLSLPSSKESLYHKEDPACHTKPQHSQRNDK